jgi:hypothetical protein
MRVRSDRLAVSVLAAVVAMLLMALAGGCTSEGEEAADTSGTDPTASEEQADGGASEEEDAAEGEPSEEPADDATAGTLAWVDVELTDVATGETFRVSDFAGEPVFVESFAVW